MRQQLRYNAIVRKFDFVLVNAVFRRVKLSVHWGFSALGRGACKAWLLGAGRGHMSLALAAKCGNAGRKYGGLHAK